MPDLHDNRLQADPSRLRAPLLRAVFGQDAARGQVGMSVVQEQSGLAGR